VRRREVQRQVVCLFDFIPGGLRRAERYIRIQRAVQFKPFHSAKSTLSACMQSLDHGLWHLVPNSSLVILNVAILSPCINRLAERKETDHAALHESILTQRLQCSLALLCFMSTSPKLPRRLPGLYLFQRSLLDAAKSCFVGRLAGSLCTSSTVLRDFLSGWVLA